MGTFFSSPIVEEFPDVEYPSVVATAPTPNAAAVAPVAPVAPVPATTCLDDIPLGVCCNCGVAQQHRAMGGFWINGTPEKWACKRCKYDVPIRSYPFACEWCTSSDVKWYQGHTYHCRRCAELNIGQALE